MRLRKLALAIGLASALGANIASALGLGEVKLNSTLNQPLDAEIRLLQVRDLTEQEILVALASSEDFQRAGVDRPFFLTDLKFTVDLTDPKGAKIKVSSRNPVREPYLNFLLETQWPNGRLLREYTLLMDLPVFSDQQAAPVTRAAPVSQPTQQARSTPPPAPVRQPEAAEPVAESSQSSAPEAARNEQSGANYGSAGDSYGPVGDADTLWEIALQARPDRSYSVHQTMLAIQRLNPEAFINGNINLLRQGQVLRLPNADQISSLNLQQAVAEVANQNAEWSGRSTEPSGPQLEAGKRLASSTEQSNTVEGRLKLASGGTDSAESGRGDGGAGGDAAALQNQLSTSLEELDRSKRESSDLKLRVAELENQIGDMERLLDVSNEQLRALQLTNQGADPAAIQDGSAAVAPVDAVGGDSSSDVVAPVASTEAKPDPTKVVSESKPAEKSPLDLLKDNIIPVGAGLLVLLGGLALYLRRRSAQQGDKADELESLPDEDNFTSPFAPDAKSQGADADSLALDADDLSLDDLDDAASSELDFGDSASSAEAETDDVVGEADIYIAYGKLDQAEEMLRKALVTDPSNTAARLKLMEVFVEGKNLAAFDEQYGLVIADPFAKGRADELRSQFGSVPAYTANAGITAGAGIVAGAAASAAAVVAASNMNDGSVEGDKHDLAADDLLDFNFDELDDAASTELPATDIASMDDELALDLDLDDLSFDLADSEDSADSFELSTDKSVDGASDHFALDFDFNLGDTELAAEADDNDLSLDFDLDSLVIPEANDSSLDVNFDEPLSDLNADLMALDTALSVPEPDALSLAESSIAEDDLKGLSLDLGEDLSMDLGEDFTLDLSDELSEQSVEFSLDDTTPAAKPSALTDDFDLSDFDAADMDLATLDQEVDALAGNLDIAAAEFGSDAVEAESLDAGLFDAPALDKASLDTDLDFDIPELTDELVRESADVQPETTLELETEVEAETETQAKTPVVMEEPLTDFGDLDFDSADSDDSTIASTDLADLDFDDLEFDLGDDKALTVGEDLADEDAGELSFEMDDLELESSLAADLPDDDLLDDALLGDTLLGDDLAGDNLSDGIDFGSTESAAEVEEFDLAADLGIDLEEVAAEDDASTDDFFNAALSDIPSSTAEDLAMDVSDDELDAELDFLADTDEAATKLDLARAYIDMGDKEGAKDILSEVVAEGNAEQQKDAEELLSRIG